MRSRESRCCSPTSPPPREIQNAACRHGHRRANSVGDNITYQFTLPLAPSRSPFNSHRNTASTKPVAGLHLRHRKSGMPRVDMTTDERAKSFGGNFTRSHIRRRRHNRRSTRIETRHRQSATRATGEFGASRLLLSNTRASDVTAAAAGISNSASYVLSVSCLFLCGPLRRISVNARFYVQCCLVL